MKVHDLYYEITDDGYHIYDRNDSMFHIHQYEPYIPNRNLSYEENAKAQIEELYAMWEESEKQKQEEQSLADQVLELKSQNEELTNALLELADIVYA